ncbi:MAG: radical SAM family heme chaperone HemW [Proteobacteria bacterium]|uniref:Heme chaperone HemW n=1 Tax=Candidatus Avisuccinivibrio stercorigallinarum TaxID=2840704 RepID=A0A9D9DBX6_9GAMM|nr:radical SAM family heme chaperone HemW [Candidatus Avisuccinivibrio stercorigallinarum]
MTEVCLTPEHLQLGLYLHYPFCLRKCPYCDFNSHPKAEFKGRVSDAAYTQRLISDFKSRIGLLSGRKFISVFIGGGTPSLLPLHCLEQILKEVEPYLQAGAEISMECNPGTLLNVSYLKELRALGVNRLSLGIQSFNDRCLKAIGRIHNAAQARQACIWAREAGFDNLNLDIMHGLPGQSRADALQDLKEAAPLASHLSWYELTLEEDSYFGAHPPVLPDEDTLADIEDEGFEFLAAAGFERYEISAFAKEGQYCRHNENYWLFGDYLGVGAGAHSKITTSGGRVLRHADAELPDAYLNCAASAAGSADAGDAAASWVQVAAEDLPFEYLLNRLRLLRPLPYRDFELAAGLPREVLQPKFAQAAADGLIEKCVCTDLWGQQGDGIKLTNLGVRMLNEVLELFLQQN